MVELKIYLSESLNEKFRRSAMSVYGYGRGSLSKAAEDALSKWCSEHEPSVISNKVAGRSGTVEGESPKGAESHVNPDERQTADLSAKGVGGDETPAPIGSGS